MAVSVLGSPKAWLCALNTVENFPWSLLSTVCLQLGACLGLVQREVAGMLGQRIQAEGRRAAMASQDSQVAEPQTSYRKACRTRNDMHKAFQLLMCGIRLC